LAPDSLAVRLPGQFTSIAGRANASICFTPEQAATKELPEEIFQFERGDDDLWRFVGKAELPSGTA
jgi:hypothetical protein